ncbi:flavin-containing amine oxidoreductase [Xylariomycetidae sp. FL0641]|nr:flavin-containing amine oxidoreductase [Xylariomycetidae sp. FL0641]
MLWQLSTLLAAGQALALPSSFPVKLETRSKLNSRLANVHVSVDDTVSGPVQYTYGPCSSLDLRDAHHVISEASTASSSRLVWRLPEDVEAGGCISAWDSKGSLVGRSASQAPKPHKRSLGRRNSDAIVMDADAGIDTLGAWFDGVELLKEKEIGAVDAEQAKSKEIAIVGAGMGGLMTYLILHQSGFTNISIIEASQRLGGRVHTEYLSGGPFDYDYQEMGPMRFPQSVVYENQTYNVTDHQLVFQLADEMNKLNNHDKNLSVDFIRWIQNNENAFYYYNGIKLDTGLPPTLKQVAENSSLALNLPLDKATQDAQSKVSAITNNVTAMIEIATNMHQAHRNFIDSGLDGLPGEQWSGFAYLVDYLSASLNTTDIVVSGFSESSAWHTLYDSVYFGATNWKTIDGGLSRLPLSFHPLVDNITTMDRRVERIQWSPETQRLNLQWRHNYTDRVFQNASFDYAVLAVPPPQLRRMRLPQLPVTISNAIQNVPFAASCKVALEYETRFWQDYANPIHGGATETDIPGIGTVTYPSYCLNCTGGPAALLASYVSDAGWEDTWASVGEAEHVAYVVDAMAEIHGEVARDQYTGRYNRRCWVLDEYEAGAWASPTVGQHQLYIPEYFKTYSNMIFVGEHTSYTHAWIASALESGVRGAVQLLLELGLVDEAKAATEKWMGRWINVEGAGALA